MRHVKILGLLTMAAASLMAFASSASGAPTLTSPAGTEYTGAIEATLEKGTSSLWKAGTEATCTESSVSGTAKTNSELHVRIGISTETFSNCTRHVVVTNFGEWTISWTGVLTTIGTEITITDTGLGISCVYGGGPSPGTSIGTLIPGTPAKIKVSTAKLQKISGSFLCPSEGTWTANYVVTKPSTLLLS